MSAKKGDTSSGVRYQIDRIDKTLTRFLEGLMTFLFIVIFALVVILVFLRYTLNTSLTGANESITILFIYTTAIGAALAIGNRQHIGITFLADMIPPRLYRVIDGLGILLIALLNVVMVGFSLEWIGATGDFMMPSTGLPRWVVQLSIPIGCGLAVLYCLMKFVRAFLGMEPLGQRWMRED